MTPHYTGVFDVAPSDHFDRPALAYANIIRLGPTAGAIITANGFTMAAVQVELREEDIVGPALAQNLKALFRMIPVKDRWLFGVSLERDVLILDNVYHHYEYSRRYRNNATDEDVKVPNYASVAEGAFRAAESKDDAVAVHRVSFDPILMAPLVKIIMGGKRASWQGARMKFTGPRSPIVVQAISKDTDALKLYGGTLPWAIQMPMNDDKE